MDLAKRVARWLAVSTVGSILLLAGVVMLFVPGPGLLAIAAGLAVLSIEFRWAQRLREQTVRRLRDVRERRREARAAVPGDDGHDNDHRVDAA